LRDCCDPHRAEELAAGQRCVLVVVGLAIARPLRLVVGERRAGLGRGAVAADARVTR
jgi:hypothetical protein